MLTFSKSEFEIVFCLKLHSKPFQHHALFSTHFRLKILQNLISSWQAGMNIGHWSIWGPF